MGGRGRAAAEGHRFEDALAHGGTPSGVKNLIRVLDKARSQLLEEHHALRGEAQAAVELLVQSGFSPAQLERARAELHALRQRLAAQRKRLHTLQRRLKSAAASAGKTGDADFARQLGAQLEQLRNVEPGLARAMLALQVLEQAYAGSSDGGPPALRLTVPSDAGARSALGDALVSALPGAAVADFSVGLLREGVAAPTPPPPPHRDLPRALAGTRALVDALLPGHGSPSSE